MEQLILIFGISFFALNALAQVVDNQPAFVAWSARDVNDAECTGAQIYANYNARLGTCYTLDQQNAYTAQLVSTDYATITFFSDEYCRYDGASAIEANSESCTLAGYGATSEYSIMFVSTDQGKKSLMEADIKQNGVQRDTAWENIRLMLKNSTLGNSQRRSPAKTATHDLAKTAQASELQERLPTEAPNDITASNTGVEVTPRAVNTIHYLYCPGTAGGHTKLSLCVNQGVHCDDNGVLISHTILGPYGSCNVLCSCRTYIYHDELRKTKENGE